MNDFWGHFDCFYFFEMGVRIAQENSQNSFTHSIQGPKWTWHWLSTGAIFPKVSHHWFSTCNLRFNDNPEKKISLLELYQDRTQLGLEWRCCLNKVTNLTQIKCYLWSRTFQMWFVPVRQTTAKADPTSHGKYLTESASKCFWLMENNWLWRWASWN